MYSLKFLANVRTLVILPLPAAIPHILVHLTMRKICFKTTFLAFLKVIKAKKDNR